MNKQRSRKRRKMPGWASREAAPGRSSFTEERPTGRSPLPAGVWHANGRTASRLASTAPLVREASHVPSGARFRLACSDGGEIVAVCADDEQAEALIAAAWGDPVRWAAGEHWWLQTPTEQRGNG